MGDKNAFISHIHEDDERVGALKDLAAERGLTVRDGSITTEKFNDAKSERYIKEQILRPRITWCSTLVVLVSKDTHKSPWVNWEIEEAAHQGKRIVVVHAHGDADAELPDAAKDLADAIVGWNSERVVDAIQGEDIQEAPDGSPRALQPVVRQPHC